MDTQEIVFTLHLITLGFLILTIYQADRLGVDWVLGKEQLVFAEEIRQLHKRMWIGLAFMITTGFILFWPMREFLLTRPQFYAKMTFVLALVVNGLLIGHLQKVATYKSFAMLSTQEKIPLFLSGAVSIISWIGAAILAFFLIPE